MSKVKQVKVALLALVAALVIAIPSMAFAATLSITSDTTGDVYKAYQVFDGTVDSTNTVLSDISWGVNIKQDENSLVALYAEINALAEVSGVDSPEKAVKAMTNDNAADFAKIFGKKNDQGEYVYLTGTGTAFTETSKTYATGALDPGYWLVEQDQAGKADANDETTTGSKTNFIAYLVGSENVGPIKAKASIPQVYKGVVEDSKLEEVLKNAEDNAKATKKTEYLNSLANYGLAADYDIETDIPYYIAGDLPSTYDGYKFYYYKFNDHMSNGLQYVENSAKIYIYNNGVQGDEISINSQDVKLSWSEDHVLTVEIADLKKYVPSYSENIKIVVFYRAKLTGDSVVYGNPGNPNDVSLTFSNNPNQDKGGTPETGETPRKYAVVFTYELDNTKVNQANKDEKLSGAVFVLQNNDPDSEDYGKYAKVQSGKFVAWETLSNTDAATDDHKLISSATEANKGRFDVKGLDAGKYKLIELVAPDQYSIGGPFDFEIKATLPADTAVTITGGSISEFRIVNQETADGNNANGVVTQKIGNDKGSGLPSTGGIGTTIFYVVGGTLVLVALVAMVARRRRSATTA